MGFQTLPGLNPMIFMGFHIDSNINALHYSPLSLMLPEPPTGMLTSTYWMIPSVL